MRRTLRTGPIDVDQIVANYTALGRAQRRKLAKRRWTRAGATTAIVVGAALVWLGGAHTSLLDRSRESTIGALQSMVRTEIEKLDAARAELKVERERFVAKSAELQAELTAFASRHAELESQQSDLSAQSAELRAALGKVDAEREALVAAQSRGPAVERELLAIGEQRHALEQQWQSFTDQGKQLSTELEALERQRDALEAERASMERQRRDLETLLDSAAAGPRAASDNQIERLPLPRSKEEPLFATAVDADHLGNMRAGLQLPNGMNVAIGLTRTATINGEEQPGSSLRIDDLTRGIDPAALGTMRPLVIQNGDRNLLGPELLNAGAFGLGTIIQNTRDNQDIRTSTIYDVSIEDVSRTLRDMAASQALSDSLSLQR